MKKSFANCTKCKLFESLRHEFFKTNSSENLLLLDAMYIAEFKDWDIILDNLKDTNVKYFITSPILCDYSDCSNNLELESISEFCGLNIQKMIEKCNPKKIITIGELSKKYQKEDISEHYSNIQDLYPVENLVSFDGDFDVIKNNPTENIQKEPDKETTLQISNNNVYMFNIPEKYYTNEYRLIDVQHIVGDSRIIYIFRDKNNNKEIYDFPDKDNNFYWYESLNSDTRIIEPYNNLQLKIGNHRDRCLTQRGYGGDTNLTTLHSADYFLQNKEEAPIIKKNIFFFDIEVYTGKHRIFPNPTEAKFPINAISFDLYDDDIKQIYLLKIPGEIDNRIDEIIESRKYNNITLFTNETSLIRTFLATLTNISPDFIAGWNALGFDIPYVVNRMKKLGIELSALSPFNNVYSDGHKTIISGYIPLDQLLLYKELTYINLPSYKLDAIAEKETGKKKVKYEGNLDTLYTTNIDTFIQYSLMDTELLKSIEQRTQHISLQDELRRITTTSQSGARSTLGQAEGLFLTSMKKKGLIARNTIKGVEKEILPGAYVFEARGGLYDGILCDFDFTSLYPSIINSWNIGPDTLIGKVSEEIIFDLIYNKESIKELTINIDPIHNTSLTKMSIDQFNKWIQDNNATINIAGTIYKGHDKYPSIFRSVIEMLFDGRKIYKKKMFDAKQANNKNDEVAFNGKQMAYKILANSLYGALGNEHFKFYNLNLAKSITLAGQELLKYSTVHLDHFLVNRGNVKEFQMNKDFMNKVKSLTDVIYGDTDSAFCYLTDYLKDKKIEVKKSPEVLGEIQKIQDFVNDKVLNEFIKYHNIQKQYSMIFLKNEFLFSKYYTLNGKKHYAAKVISQEGRNVEDIEIKGLELKRSEIPKRSQKLLVDVLNIILSDIPKDQIKDAVDRKVEEGRKDMISLIEKRSNDIVRSVSYSKPLKQYKVIPRHLKAMLIWNELVSEDFRYGSRGFLWNLTAIEINKAPEEIKKNFHNKFLKKFQLSDLDCICLPEDVSRLPDWCIPDMKKIIEYSCDDRVANLTEPLWKETDQLLLW